jgi:hypothetical protein
MAELATYIGVEPRTEICGADIARGLRVVYNLGGAVTLASIGVRGDYISLIDGKNGEPSTFVSASGGGKVPAVASVAVNQGDLAYSAAAGQVSNVSAGAILMGRWTTTTAIGTLGEIELFPIA